MKLRVFAYQQRTEKKATFRNDLPWQEGKKKSGDKNQ